MANAPGTVTTPDFYDYPQRPIERIAIDGAFVEIAFVDGATLRAYGPWLVENAVGRGGVDPATREGLIDPALLDLDTKPIAADINPEGHVVIDFAPGPAGATYHSGWLHHVAIGAHRPGALLPVATSWTAQNQREPRTHDGSRVLEDRTILLAWVDDMLAHGVARLRGCGTDPGFGTALAGLIGPPRDTNFGPSWDVKADITMVGADDTNSTANSTLRLGPHTDLPTRETPPGFQFLHCVVNETAGGWSTMTDGLAVVEALRNDHPEHYDALTTLNWVFFNRGPNIDHRWSAPLIDLGQPTAPLTLRAFYPVRGFPDMAPDDVPRAYAAMRVFSQLAASDRFQMRYPFEQGDLVGFDNRRILHGRDAFSSGGERHLRGLYIDHDEILSFARVSHRRINTIEGTT